MHHGLHEALIRSESDAFLMHVGHVSPPAALHFPSDLVFAQCLETARDVDGAQSKGYRSVIFVNRMLPTETLSKSQKSNVCMMLQPLFTHTFVLYVYRFLSETTFAAVYGAYVSSALASCRLHASPNRCIRDRLRAPLRRRVYRLFFLVAEKETILIAS